MLGRRWAVAGSALVCAGGLALASGTAVARPAAGPPAHASAAGRSPAGTFVLVDSKQVETGVPGVLVNAKHQGYVVWPTPTNGSVAHLKVVQIARSGKVGTPANALSGSWSSFGGQLTLVPGSPQPQVVFVGGGAGQFLDSCVYVASGSALPWSARSGSLSNDCANPEPAAAESSNGTVAAAWAGAGGTNLLYRIGVSSSIPASGSDGVISVASSVAGSGIALQPSNQHFIAGWIQVNGSGKDGYYAEDVSAGGSPRKMPGTGTNSVNHLSIAGDMPMASTSHGTFMAACSNGTTCRLMVWKVGAKKALTVPHAKIPYTAALSAGPSGRLWVAWGSQANNTVSVTRTNKADTRFGPVHTYHSACAEHEIVAISGPTTGGADVALECVAEIHHVFVQALYVTHVLSALSAKVKDSGHTVTVTVSDAGNPVSGAKVKLGSATKKTSTKGTVSFHVAKAGVYQVVAKHSGYLPAHAKARVA